MSNKQRLWIVDDDVGMRDALECTIAEDGQFEVSSFSSAAAALSMLSGAGSQRPALIISDQKMPGMDGLEFLREIRRTAPEIPFIMITAYGTVNSAVDAMKHGASDFLTKPFDAQQIKSLINRVLSRDVSEGKKVRTSGLSENKPLLTADPVMKRVLEIGELVARSDTTVLLQGESGTGKELIARFIHKSSLRHSKQFVAVNCAALPDNLLESELFGYEKGAFTGASQRKPGKFELAQGGTILLDEISEMDLLLQAKLLRVIQEKEVDVLGGTIPLAVDVRIVATTNRSLEQMVQRGEFRADLFYRLNVIPLTIPPLRKRKADIGLLLDHFMRVYLGKDAAPVPESVRTALEHYPWAGNVRELQNAVERAAILCRGNAPRKEDFLLGGTTGLSKQVEVLRTDSTGNYQVRDSDQRVSQETVARHESRSDSLTIQSGLTVHEVEKRLIYETLKATAQNRSKAAGLLGISVRTLRNKLNEYEGG